MSVITISREFGSGGREIGKRLADEMGFEYYDKEILSKISENLELDEGYIENRLEQGYAVNFPYVYCHSFSMPFYFNDPVNDIIAEQHKIIHALAEKGNCVIVGRGADVILKAFNPFNIFVYADMEAKIVRCKNRMSGEEAISERELERRIKQIDKARAKSYSIVSKYPWGDKRAYHLCINTTDADIPKLTPKIADIARLYFEEQSR